MDYAINITLKPQRRDWELKDYLSHVRDELPWLTSGLVQLPYKLSLSMELTKAGIPHFHGLIRMERSIPSNYPVRWLNLKLNQSTKKSSKLFGWILVRPLTDWPVWRNYCLKEILITMDLTATFPIMIDQLGVLPNQFEVLMDRNKFQAIQDAHDQAHSE